MHSLATLIGQQEGLEGEDLLILEAAAYVHDIGIRAAEEKCGKSNGKLQEQEGPALAEELLAKVGFSQKIIDRVSYLVGHHHTYSDIQGLDYQILVEADFLVNLYEDESNISMIQSVYEKIFRTETGKEICRKMYQI